MRVPGRSADWEPSSRSTTVATGALLVAANLVPLAMLQWGGWSPGDVLVTYWLENIVVGVFGVLRIVTARGASSGPPRIALAGFFVLHYGIFTLVHGVFTIIIAASIGLSSSVDSWLLVVLGLAASHGISFVLTWFRGGERDRTTPAEAMMQPYSRVVVLHVVVLASAFLLIASTSGSLGGGALDSVVHYRMLPAALLVGLKTTVDLVSHVRVHRRLSSATPDPAPVAPAG